jgi:hypothetical protein
MRRPLVTRDQAAGSIGIWKRVGKQLEKDKEGFRIRSRSGRYMLVRKL